MGKHRLARFAGIAAVTAMAWANPAGAQFYGWVNGGASLMQETEATDTFAGGGGTGDISFDTGWVGSAALGWMWRGFRLEGEVAYRRNDLDKLDVKSLNLAGVGTFSGLGSFAMEGDIRSWGAMANLWYDINFGGPLVPFIGGGVGFQNIRLNIESVGGTATSFKESDTVLAYQAGAGVGYKVTPNMRLTASYRYLGTMEPTFESSTDKIEAPYHNHSILAGLFVSY